MGVREDIAGAALELVAEGGLEAVSVRTVAARAGVSPGLVQHHYGTKQRLLLAAVELVDHRVQTRLAAAASAAGDAPADRQLRHLALQLLPLDEQRRTEARVWLAFVARAAVDEQVAAVHSRAWRELQEVFAHLLAARRHPGADDDTVTDAVTDDDRDEAACLLAALDGLAVAGVAEEDRATPQRTRRLVDRLLARLPDPGPA